MSILKHTTWNQYLVDSIHQMIRLSIILIFCCASFVGLAQTGKKISQDSLYSTNLEWSKITHNEYSLDHPKEWTVDTSGTMGLALILLSPLEIAEDQFRENVNLTLEVLADSTLTLTEYIEFSKDQILQYITDAVIISTEENLDSTPPFQQMTFTGRQGVFDLYFTQRYFLINNTVYVLTMTTRITTQEKYKWYISPIFDSFQVEIK